MIPGSNVLQFEPGDEASYLPSPATSIFYYKLHVRQLRGGAVLS